MKQIIGNFKQLDRKQVLIYVFSYLIYLTLNKLFSNSVLYMLGEDSFRERWKYFNFPCIDTPHMFIISFQLFKIGLFLLLIRLSKKNKNELLSECLIAYFIYDLVYILAYTWDAIPVWDLIHLPIMIPASWTLTSTGQFFLNHYLSHLELIFAGIWTSALFIFLYKQHRLSIMFVVTRLFIITLTVPVFSIILYIIWYRLK